jgi:Nucleotidyl transferase AbiEii toxin, Type IV TA system
VNNKTGRNLLASIRQRLLDKSHLTGVPYNLTSHYYAVERFLFRLSQSKYVNHLVLRGALMFRVWQQGSLPRPTLDMNFLGVYVSNEVEALILAVQEICNQAVEPDGLTFDPASVRGIRVTSETGYPSVRARFHGSLGNARFSLQLDIGFGDVVIPSEMEVVYPSLLDFPAPHIRG